MDPERALWVPGAKVISVPKPSLKLFMYQALVTDYRALAIGRTVTGYCAADDIPKIREDYYGWVSINPTPCECSEARYHQLRGMRLHLAG